MTATDESNRRNQIQIEAIAFRIWREGNSVGWDCTARELAEAVKEPVGVVRRICRLRGWPIQYDAEGVEEGGRRGSLRRWHPGMTGVDVQLARLY